MMDLKSLSTLRSTRQRTALARRTILLLAASGVILSVSFFLFGVWFFLQYEADRLDRPTNITQIVPKLKRDDLGHFVRGLRTSAPPGGSPSPGVPTPAASPAPSPGSLLTPVI